MKLSIFRILTTNLLGKLTYNAKTNNNKDKLFSSSMYTFNTWYKIM